MGSASAECTYDEALGTTQRHSRTAAVPGRSSPASHVIAPRGGGSLQPSRMVPMLASLLRAHHVAKYVAALLALGALASCRTAGPTHSRPALTNPLATLVPEAPSARPIAGRVVQRLTASSYTYPRDRGRRWRAGLGRHARRRARRGSPRPREEHGTTQALRLATARTNVPRARIRNRLAGLVRRAPEIACLHTYRS